MSIVISFYVNPGIPGNDIANSWIPSHPENILEPWGLWQILKDAKVHMHAFEVWGVGFKETWKFHLVYFQKVIVCTGRPY